MDSNFQYAGAANLVIAPFVQPRRPSGSHSGPGRGMLATCSCYRVYPRTNDALHCAETAYRSGDDPPSHR